MFELARSRLSDHGDLLLRYRLVWPWVILLLSLAMVGGLGALLLGNLERQERQTIQMQSAEIAAGMEQRLNASEALLRAGAAAFAFVPTINADFFSSYYKGLHLDVRHLGIIAMGWTAPVTRDRLHQLENRLRAEGNAMFYVSPISDDDQIYPVLYVEPRTSGAVAIIGFNVYAEARRRAAMVKSFDKSIPQVTAPLRLRTLTPENDLLGFILYAPVYQKQSSQAGAAEGAPSFRGFIFGTFQAKSFVDAVLSPKQLSQLDVELYDITDGRRELLHDTRPEIWSAAKKNSSSNSLMVSGRKWQLVVAPVYGPQFGNSPQRLLIYFLLGAAFLVCLLVPAMFWLAMRAAAATRKALDRQVEQVEMRTILLRELNHRVKNTLATVNSLAALAREGATDVDSYYAALNGRLRALSATHDLLTLSDWGDTELRDIAEAELAPFRGVKGQVLIEGPSVRFGPTRALSLGLSIHELATNASKYGALSSSRGRVSLLWHIGEDDRLHIRWTETGGPPVPDQRERGFGSSLIENLMARQLRAQVKLDYLPEGVVCEISMPLDTPAGAPARPIKPTIEDR